MPAKRVLVVEDEAIVAADLHDRLRNLGYDPVAVVAAGEKALAKAEETGAELVLMDIQLQGAMDGIMAAEQIRAKLDIPIVFLTAHVDETTFQRAKITAPFGYVRKPFDERELHTALEIALFRHATEAELKRTHRWLNTIIETVGVPLVVTDKWGLVELMNTAAGDLSRCPREQAQLKPLAEVLHLVDPATQQPLQLPLGRDFEGESKLQSYAPAALEQAGGNSLLVDYTVTSIRDEADRVTGLVWLFTRRQVGL